MFSLKMLLIRGDIMNHCYKTGQATEELKSSNMSIVLYSVIPILYILNVARIFYIFIGYVFRDLFSFSTV